MSAKGNCICPNLRQPPPPRKNKTSAKKKYFTTNFIHLIHKACQILFTFTSQGHCPHLQRQCLHFADTPNIPILFTVIPQHIIISLMHCIKYRVLF
jgi:hypothetical protein